MDIKRLLNSKEPVKLDPETVEAYRTILTRPKDQGLSFDPLTLYFDKSETVTAKYILAKQYTDYIDVKIPKLILDIVMEDQFGQYRGKDSNGNHGYSIKFNRALPERKSYLEIGNIVIPTRSSALNLRSGCEIFEDAVVISNDPLILASRDTTMRWEATIKEEYFRVVGQADQKLLNRCLKRIKR
jgi:hypothetical protein